MSASKINVNNGDKNSPVRNKLKSDKAYLFGNDRLKKVKAFFFGNLKMFLQSSTFLSRKVGS